MWAAFVQGLDISWWMHDVGACFIGLCECLGDMALFHWLVQNQDCWLSTTRKLLSSHWTLFPVREWVWAQD